MRRRRTVFGALALRAAALIPLLLSACASLPPADEAQKIPITRKGTMAEAVLALVERQNVISDGERSYTHPDGLAFYFVVYPYAENRRYPTIKEAQNFTVDGENYWQNRSGAIDSYTVIYDEKAFANNERAAAGRIGVRPGAGAFIQKTVICGAPLPAKGVVRYVLYFGFEQRLEEFEFIFRLQDIP
jgi:hypothetical protein